MTGLGINLIAMPRHKPSNNRGAPTSNRATYDGDGAYANRNNRDTNHNHDRNRDRTRNSTTRRTTFTVTIPENLSATRAASPPTPVRGNRRTRNRAARRKRAAEAIASSPQNMERPSIHCTPKRKKHKKERSPLQRKPASGGTGWAKC